MVRRVCGKRPRASAQGRHVQTIGFVAIAEGFAWVVVWGGARPKPRGRGSRRSYRGSGRLRQPAWASCRSGASRDREPAASDASPKPRESSGPFRERRRTRMPTCRSGASRDREPAASGASPKPHEQLRAVSRTPTDPHGLPVGAAQAATANPRRPAQARSPARAPDHFASADALAWPTCRSGASRDRDVPRKPKAPRELRTISRAPTHSHGPPVGAAQAATTNPRRPAQAQSPAAAARAAPTGDPHPRHRKNSPSGPGTR